MEIWKDIVGFEGKYRVSDDGLVYSVRRNKILKPKTTKDGYLAVCLWDGNNNHRRVHRLVAQAFVERKNGCDVVNHINCDKKDNRASNLEWTTVQENTKHAYENIETYRNHVQRINKLGVETRRIKIDAFYNGKYIGSYESKKEAAEKTGVSEKTIYNRLHGNFSSRSGYSFAEKVVI